MTLKYLLENDSLKELVVINHKADLNRTVSTIESTETPDIISFVPVNCFIITTAMVYKDHQEELCDLILRLNVLPCAGLGIKLGRFIDRLDQRVIETADSVGFPLIRIPMNRTLGEIYHRFLSLIWDNENKDLLNALNIQKKFYNLVLHGASLKRLLNMMGSTVKKHVLIVDMFGEICGSSNTSRYEEQAAVRVVKKINKEDNEYWQQAFTDEGRSKGRQVYVYPIRSINRNTHYLVIFDDESTSAISAFVMEEVLLIFGMHFYKNLYIFYNEMQFRDSFLKIMVDVNKNECWSPRQILAIGQAHGLKPSAYYRVIIARFMHGETQKFQTSQFMRREERYILVYDYLKRKIEEPNSGDIVVLADIDNWRYVLILQNNGKNLDKRLREINETLQEVFHEQMFFAYGNSAYDVGSIANSFWEAVESLNNMSAKQETMIQHYQPKNILELLKGISSRQIDDVCKRMLKELAFPDDEMNVELKRTLKAYLDCHCSIMETANRLYLHRNTVRYRIKKCEEILENDLSDWDYCFQLQLCLILSDM